MTKDIGVGVCLLVVKEKKLLVAERIGEFGKGFLATAGGHQEKNERWEQTALRELAEEAGHNVKVNIKPNSFVRQASESNIPLFVTNNILMNAAHYVTVWLRSEWLAGDPENKEPTKKREWIWLTFEEIIKDPRMREGVEAMTSGRFHDSLHWLPLPELLRFRERIGL